MTELLNIFYFEDDPLKTLVAVLVFAFTFEFVLSFAYILRSGKNGVSV